jgi:hypothetical protein
VEFEDENNAHPALRLVAYVKGASPTMDKEVTVRLNVDPGARVSLVRMDVCEALGAKMRLSAPDQRLKMVDAFDKSFEALGTTKLLVRTGNILFSATFWVVEALVAPLLLGTDLYDIERMDLRVKNSHQLLQLGARVVTPHDTAPRSVAGVSPIEIGQDSPELRALLDKYADVFWEEGDELGCANNYVANVKLLGNPSPVACAPYRVSHTERKKIQMHLQEMMRLGIIKPAGQSAWAAPLLLVRKPAGGDRVVSDFRKLNKVIAKHGYPLPRIDDILDSMAGAELFSVMDLVQGFHQVPITAEASDIFTFVTMDGMYSYQRLPQGAKISPNVFQQVIDLTFRGLKYRFVIAYIDDVLVWSSQDLGQHLERLEEVFLRLRQANLKLKKSKCRFLMTEVTFLGHRLSAEGVAPMKDKVEAIDRFTAPRTLKELRSFLGLCNYYRRFIPKFAATAAPLYELLKKGVKWTWRESQEVAMATLKLRLKSEPIVVPPDYNLPFVLSTDAANKFGLGAVLAQIHQDGEKVIAYASRSLTPAEKNLADTHEVECLAVVWAVKTFRCYLAGEQEFTIYTDHQALVSLMKTPNLTGKKARWVTFLQEFSFRILHRKGVDNANADALSRTPAFGVASPEVPLGSSPVVHAAAIAAISQVNANKNCLDVDELIRQQRADAQLALMIRYLESGELPSLYSSAARVKRLSSLYVMLKDAKSLQMVLYRKVLQTKRARVLQNQTPEEVGERIAIPKSLVGWVLRRFHDSLIEGSHLGIQKTFRKIKSRFHWDGMYGDVVRHVTTCKTCQAFPGHGPLKHAFMQRIVATKPMQVVELDVLGPFPKSHDGNVYVIVMICVFTKWLEAFPSVSADGPAVTHRLTQFFMNKGFPELIISDGAKAMTSNIVTDLCRALSIDHHVGSPYQHGSTGQAERVNRTLEAMLQKHVAEDQKNWDTILDYHLCAYRDSVHASTQYSPFFMMHGREMNMPADVKLPHPVQEKQMRSSHEYVRALLRNLGKAYRLAKENLDKAYQVQAKQFNAKVRHQSQFKIGDLVYRYVPVRKVGFAEKLLRKWYGPYEIISQPGPVSFELKEVKRNKRGKMVTKRVTVHVSHMKPHRVANPDPTEGVEVEVGSKQPLHKSSAYSSE